MLTWLEAAKGVLISFWIGVSSLLPNPGKPSPRVSIAPSATPTASINNRLPEKSFAGNGTVNLKLELMDEGDFHRVNVLMESGQGGEKVKAIGVDLVFDNQALSLLRITCGQLIPSLITNGVESNGTVNITCFKPGGSGDLVFEKGKSVVLATFLVNRIAGGPVVSEILITQAQIPDSSDYHNLAGRTIGVEIDW